MIAKRIFYIIMILIISFPTTIISYAADDATDGFTYYFAANGSLDNTGLSPDSPLAFEFANKFAFKNNDTILFKRGDTFYGTLKPAVSFDTGIFTVGAYGKGALPQFCNVQITKTKWQKDSNGFYSFDLKDVENHTGVGGTESDICRIEALNGKAIGTLCDDKEYCLKKYDYCIDNDCVYMKTDKEPFAEFGQLVFVLNMNGAEISSNYSIKNLRFYRCGKNGIDFGTTVPSNVTISGCEIDDFGSQSTDERIAGINMSFGADNVTVKKTKITNGYGTAFAVSGYNDHYWHDIYIKNNIIMNNTQSIRINYSGDNEQSGVDGLYFMNNICVNQGKSIENNDNENPDGMNQCSDILLNGFSAGFYKFAFKGNTFYNSGSKYCTFSINSAIIEKFREISVSQNSYYLQSRDSVILSMNSPTDELQMTDYSLKDIEEVFKKERGSEIYQYDKLNTKEKAFVKNLSEKGYKDNLEFIDNSDINYVHKTEIADPITIMDILKKYDITVTVSAILFVTLSVTILLIMLINRKRKIIYSN